MKRTRRSVNIDTKHYFSANGSILLPLALKWRLLYMAVGLLALLVLPGITAHQASAYSITLEVPSKLSLVLQPDGVFRSQDSATPVKITSDAFAGYTFTIKSAAPDGSNALKSGDYSIKSISAAGNEETFGMNTWGFKWSKKGGSAGATYLPGPTTGTVIDATTEANAVANEYTFTLGAKVDGNIAAGNYTGSFALMVTATPVPYTISYDQNTTDSVSGMPAQQTGRSENGQVILAANKPQRDNYRFIGWCDIRPKPQGDSNIETCSEGSFYKSGDSFALKEKNEQSTLYAVWAKPTQIMQNWEGCAETELHQLVPLIDIRDGQLYTVTKYADDNCWITTNLRIGSNEKTTLLSSADTDMRDGNSFTLPKGETGVGTANGETGWHYAQLDTAHIYIDDNNGGYYSWYAATVGEGGSTKESGNTQQSVCPKGWRLPTHEEISVLTHKYNSQTSLKSPLNFERFGHCDEGGCPRHIGVYGNWWTSTAYDRTYSYILYTGGFFLDAFLNQDDGKGGGRSLRCIARDEVKSMQAVDEWGNSIEKGQAAKVIDERDGNIYTVSRLEDGKLWMTRNLQLGNPGSAMTLTPDDSDVSQSYALPASSTSGFNAADSESFYLVRYNDTEGNNALTYDITKAFEYGGYYTWCAATAGTCKDVAIDKAQASDSICPKGWRLPTSEEIGVLTNQPTNKIAGNFTVYAGYCDGTGFPLDDSNYGYWWSSSADDNENVYRLRANNSNFDFASSAKNLGLSVRCVAR